MNSLLIFFCVHVCLLAYSHSAMCNQIQFFIECQTLFRSAHGAHSVHLKCFCFQRQINNNNISYFSYFFNSLVRSLVFFWWKQIRKMWDFKHLKWFFFFLPLHFSYFLLRRRSSSSFLCVPFRLCIYQPKSKHPTTVLCLCVGVCVFNSRHSCTDNIWFVIVYFKRFLSLSLSPLPFTHRPQYKIFYFLLRFIPQNRY